MNQKEIIKKRLITLEKHYIALKEYKSLINELLQEINIYNISLFYDLQPKQKAILDAYLKRFSSLQDYLGAKIFPLILELAGISGTKMSEVLCNIEKEQIIDNLENWIELRQVRNELEHDYPEELEKALDDLRFCIDNFQKMEKYYFNTLNFAQKYINETI